MTIYVAETLICRGRPVCLPAGEPMCSSDVTHAGLPVQIKFKIKNPHLWFFLYRFNVNKTPTATRIIVNLIFLKCLDEIFC